MKFAQNNNPTLSFGINEYKYYIVYLSPESKHSTVRESQKYPVFKRPESESKYRRPRSGDGGVEKTCFWFLEIERFKKNKGCLT